MPFPLKPISSKYKTEFLAAKTLFDREIAKPKTYERDLIIEACFLKCVISWEEFIENYTLTCLCEGEIRRNVIIKPKRGMPVQTSLYDAFKSLKPTKPDWHNYYQDWIKPEALKDKIFSRFDAHSRLHIVYADTTKHNQIITVRNAIAHSSRKTIKLLEDMFISFAGALPFAYVTSSIKPVDFLIETDSTGKSFFYILLDFYNYLESALMR